MRGRRWLLLVLFGLQPLGCGDAETLKKIVDGPPADGGPDESEGTPEGRLVFTPERLDFGVVTVGSEEKRRVAVRNVGEAPLSLRTIHPLSPFKAADESIDRRSSREHRASRSLREPPGPRVRFGRAV